jgi:hypothetical protein
MQTEIARRLFLLVSRYHSRENLRSNMRSCIQYMKHGITDILLGLVTELAISTWTTLSSKAAMSY